jgi:hypothetical protein
MHVCVCVCVCVCACVCILLYLSLSLRVLNEYFNLLLPGSTSCGKASGETDQGNG